MNCVVSLERIVAIGRRLVPALLRDSYQFLQHASEMLTQPLRTQ
jgi:hypothetical protein